MKKVIDLKVIISESKKEEDFKEYINKINNVFGEDYALVVLTSNENIERSLGFFTSKNNLNSINIESILFQSAILSQKNKFHSLFTERTDRDFWFEYFLKIESDMSFKKGLIKELLRDNNTSNMKLFNKLKTRDEREIALYNMFQLKKYEKSLSAQVEQQKRRELRSLKKGNY